MVDYSRRLDLGSQACERVAAFSGTDARRYQSTCWGNSRCLRHASPFNPLPMLVGKIASCLALRQKSTSSNC